MSKKHWYDNMTLNDMRENVVSNILDRMTIADNPNTELKIRLISLAQSLLCEYHDFFGKTAEKASQLSA